jgi:flagellar biosynthesis/type III secretory pathway chaperone
MVWSQLGNTVDGPNTEVAMREDGTQGRGTEEHLARLAEILEAEADVYQEMLEITTKERLHLVDRDLDALRDTAARKESLIGRIDALEAERREAVAVVTERLTGRGGALTISEILSLVRTPERERIKGLRGRILEEITRIQRISETNAYLVGSSLEVIGEELALMGVDDEAADDARENDAALRPRAQLIDRRA